MKINLFFKTSLLAFLLVFFAACSQDDISPDKSTQPNLSKSRQITQKQALKFSEKAIQAIFENEDNPLNKSKSNLKSTLKSGKPVDKKVQAVYTDDGKVAMYIINFGNNDGYMVVSGDKESSSHMLAFNDRGSMDLSSLDKNSPVAFWLEEKRKSISEDLNSERSLDAKNYDMWWDGLTNTDNNAEITLKLLSTRTKEGKSTLKGGHFGSWGLANIPIGSEIYYNEWGQGAPYNANAVNGAYVGCPAVAIGILCSWHGFPTFKPTDSIGAYKVMPKKLPANLNTPNSISRLFRKIADAIPGYDWGKGPGEQSGAHPDSILLGLKNLGYKNAKLDTYSFKEAYRNMEKSLPVLLAGFNSNGGHIWIAQGYWEQCWEVSVGPVKWYRYINTFYMNWGWNGIGNGWIDQSDWIPDSVNANYNSSRKLFYDLSPNR